MAFEAEVVSVSRPGESVNVLVVFIKNGTEVGRETISFPSSQVIDEAVLRQRIDEAGSRIETSAASDGFARTQVGRRFPVLPLQASPQAGAGAPQSR